MKKPELTATSVEKFLIEKFDSVSDLMQLSEGEESRAFSFDVGGRGYVLRVNSCADGFYKDRYVYRHFASAALPIPEVLDIGEFSESLTYCISRRAQGVTLQDLPETELPAVLQPVAEAMDAIPALAAPRHASTALFSCRFKCPCPPRRQRHFHGNADRAYNTLHFASKVVCQGASPFGNPRQQNRLNIPHFPGA